MKIILGIIINEDNMTIYRRFMMSNTLVTIIFVSVCGLHIRTSLTGLRWKVEYYTCEVYTRKVYTSIMHS